MSRFFLNETDSLVHCLSSSIYAQNKIEFQEATRNDHVLAKIIDYHYNGWLDKKNKVSDSLKFLYKMHNGSHVEDNLVFLNYKLICISIESQKLYSQIITKISFRHLQNEREGKTSSLLARNQCRHRKHDLIFSYLLQVF